MASPFSTDGKAWSQPKGEVNFWGTRAASSRKLRMNRSINRPDDRRYDSRSARRSQSILSPLLTDLILVSPGADFESISARRRHADHQAVAFGVDRSRNRYSKL
jgi:hypothetical protein